MATSFGALCTDFYVNHKLTMKMDLPTGRDTVLHLFDRIRAEQPSMSKFRRYPDELSLESSRREGACRWLSLQQNFVRTGFANPDSLEEAYDLHRLVMRQSPYHLSISPLDIESQELLFGFDLETKTNQHQVVFDALLADSPMASLVQGFGGSAVDVQPVIGFSLSEDCRTQAFFEVKSLTSNGQIRKDRYRNEPISILLTIRKVGPVDSVDDLVSNLAPMAEHAEQLATERLIPGLLTPIRALVGTA